MFGRRKQKRAEKEQEFADLSLGGDSGDGRDEIEAWIGEDVGAEEPAPPSRHRRRDDDRASRDDYDYGAGSDGAEPRRGDDRRDRRDDHRREEHPVAARKQSYDTGPWDLTEAPTDDDVPRIDLGALRVPTPAGVELRLEADQTGQIVTVALIFGNSTLNLGVFAAPKSAGIWDEVSEDLLSSIKADGGQGDRVTGEFGDELSVRVPTPDGLQPLRFVGIDGPRWFVRAVYSGPAAVDPTQMGPLGEVLRGLIVVRGGDAMPVRDPLPLHLPAEIAQQAGAPGTEEPEERPRLQLPKRGPEITERR